MIGDIMGLMDRLERLRAGIPAGAKSWTPTQRKEFAEIRWDWGKLNHDRMDPARAAMVEQALGWGLLGLDKALEALAALLGSLQPSDGPDAVGYVVAALKASRGFRDDPIWSRIPTDFDPDAPGGGPFGRVIGGEPPPGFAGPPPSASRGHFSGAIAARAVLMGIPVQFVTREISRESADAAMERWLTARAEPSHPIGDVVWTDKHGEEIGRSEITSMEARYLDDDEPDPEGGTPVQVIGIDHGNGGSSVTGMVWFKGQIGKAAERRRTGGWIGVDFDGTLATKARWPDLGEPVPAMVERVRAWVAAGIEVRILSVRAAEGHARIVQDWLEAQDLPRLEVTDRKDAGMFQLWDDRAVRVEVDTGAILGPDPEEHAAMRRK